LKPWLAQRLVDRPDALAFSYGDASFDYAEAAQEVQRRAARLDAIGIGRGSRVGLLGENSLDWVFCAHAVFWLGATLVPLHPRASRAELDFQLSEVKLDLVLVGRTDHTLDDVDLPVLPLSETCAPHGTECAPADTALDDVMTVLFTSGTTGTPKAVPLTIDNHLSSANASSARLGLCEDDHWLCCLPLCHVGGLAIVLRSAIYGTSFELMDAFSADEVLATLANRPVTLASFVPTMVHRLLDADRLDAAGGDIASKLRAVLVGGGPVTDELLTEARLRGLPTLPTYGMTEAGSQLATLSPHTTDGRLGTAGTVLDGVELRIERPDGSECTPGESGAIWARGPMLTAGYLDRPDANTKSVHDRRFRDGWFRTGDVGTLDADGFLRIEHRKSDLIVTGGENVDPSEVEAVLRKNGAVADVAVVGVDDAHWGQVVAALVVPAMSSDQSKAIFEQLEANCREQLAAFKAPRRWMFCDALPRTASGKIRRDQARSLFDGPDDSRLRYTSEDSDAR
jgi:O-succinylbenzoic acid--CoA ligase